MFFLHNRKQHLEDIRQKEAVIQSRNKKLEKSMNSDIDKLNKLNKILGNGIALYITSAVGQHE